MKSKPTNSWASLLSQEILSRELRPKGKEWSTAEQIAENEGIAIHCAKRRISSLLRAGKLEMFRGTEVRNGRLNNQVWYKIKGAK